MRFLVEARLPIVSVQGATEKTGGDNVQAARHQIDGGSIQGATGKTGGDDV